MSELQEDFMQEVANAEEKVLDTGKQPNIDDQNDDKQLSKRRKRGKNQDNDARRESHKLIEQKRRQRINEKINELRELLNYPDGSQNKSVVLQAAVENIRYLKMACSRMLQHYRQMQEEHLQLIGDNDRLRKVLEQQGIKPPDPTPLSQDADKANGDPSKPKFTTPVDFPAFLYSDESNAQALSVLSSSLSVSPLTRSASAIQMMPSMPSLGLSASSFSTPNQFGSNVQDVTPQANGTATTATTPGPTTTPASALTSTETENGVSITRLMFTGNN